MKKYFLLLTSATLIFKIGYSQTNVSGFISSNTTWTLAGSPYIIVGNTLLDSGFTLTIDPGVMVKFNSKKSLQISGILRAIGTNTAQITFTSNTITPASGDWDYILFNTQATDYDTTAKTGCIMQYCIVEYGGGDPSKGAVHAPDAVPYFNYCNIRNNANSGLFINASGPAFKTVYIINSTFTNNNTTTGGGGGAYLEGGAGYRRFYITGCLFSNNSAVNGGGAIEGGGGAPSGYTFYITGNTFLNNSTWGSVNSSGGAMNLGGSVLISDNVICNNSAYQYGGGISFYASGLMKDNIIYNNNTPYYGGGIAVFSSPLITNNVIAHNSASNSGAICNADNIVRNHIVDNTSTDQNQAIGQYLGLTAFNYNTITRNITTGTSSAPVTSVVYLSAPGAGTFPFYNNNIYGDYATYEIWNANLTGNDIMAKNCWWGTTSTSVIDSKIWDYFDNATLGIVYYAPYKSSPDTTAPVTPPVNVIKTDLGGGKIKVTWNTNPEIDLAGYKIYYGSPTGYSFANFINAGNVNTYTLSSTSITDTIALTAYDSLADGTKDMFEGHESWFTNAVGKPIPAFSASPIPVCAGDTVFFTDLTPTTYSYTNTTWSWSFPGGMPAVSSAQNPKVIYYNSGTYSVKLVVTNIAGSDSITMTNYIAVDTLPNPTITPSGQTIFCQGDSVMLNVGTGYSSYQWSTGESTQTIVVNQTGTYSATVSNNCGNSTTSISVTVNPIPTVGPMSPVSICTGQSATLCASGGIFYSWAPGNQTFACIAITPTASTTYTVTIADASGCTNNDSVMVTVNSLPSVALALNPDTVCIGSGAYALTGGSPNGGIYSGTGVSAGNFDPAVAGTGTHTITYSYTDVNGCTDSSSAQIYVDLCTGLQTFSDNQSVTIFPNPFSTQTVLQTDNLLHNATLTVYNCFGQTVAQIKNISGQTVTFSRGNLSSGLYFVRLTTPSPVLGEGGGEVYTGKLVITDK
ncbi:MAG: PKD domain-containing protein [Bacteroidetes bacterium]|nr:PKD domain-containing protein [Bacteroidota bacterium]